MLVGPEELNVALGATVMLVLLEMQDMVCLQVEPLVSLDLVLALVCHRLLCDSSLDPLLCRGLTSEPSSGGQTTPSNWLRYSTLETER